MKAATDTQVDHNITTTDKEAETTTAFTRNQPNQVPVKTKPFTIEAPVIHTIVETAEYCTAILVQELVWSVFSEEEVAPHHAVGPAQPRARPGRLSSFRRRVAGPPGGRPRSQGPLSRSLRLLKNRTATAKARRPRCAATERPSACSAGS